MTALIIRARASRLPLPDACVDLVVTSPPYWLQRKYGDTDGEYPGQIGAEPTPAEYLHNLWDATAEWARVLKPGGSMFVNMGDKYAQRPGQFGPQGATGAGATWLHAAVYADLGPHGPEYPVPPKSLLGLPWRYALGCVDHLGLILRRDNVWHKVNPLPESVTDRCPTAHEYVFHLTRGPRYFSAADEIREPHADVSANTMSRRTRTDRRLDLVGGGQTTAARPLGKIPGSVWPFPSEPLRVPPELKVDHFAAFPTALPRRCILGWTPRGICVECGEGRQPVASRERIDIRPGYAKTHNGERDGVPQSGGTKWKTAGRTDVAITGYTCACPQPSAPTRPAVVLDPMGGAGTVALVADVLGRTGISADPVHGYGRIARWRTADPRQRARAAGGPARAKPGVQLPLPGQAELFEGAAG